MRAHTSTAALVSAVLVLSAAPAQPCTSVLVARGASADGSTMITYAADSHALYGELYMTPAGVHGPGALRDVVEWDTRKHLGRIPQPPFTYQTIGNMNEHQVAITESTWGGRQELAGPAGIIDYGSLIWIALERSKTAREAIRTMASLVEEHGYASTGESFSISDPNEVWLMEMIGKGEGRNGAVWVALRVPEGHVTAHANHARIRTFPLADPGNALFSKDVVSFAREKGWFSGRDEEFSFADTYAPLDFGALRFCEARVWSVFRRAAPSLRLPVDLIRGDVKAERLPLWVRPDRKLSVADVMALHARPLRGHRARHDEGRGRGTVRAALPLAAHDVGGGRREARPRAGHLHAADRLLSRLPVALVAARPRRRGPLVRPRRHLQHRVHADVRGPEAGPAQPSAGARATSPASPGTRPSGPSTSSATGPTPATPT